MNRDPRAHDLNEHDQVADLSTLVVVSGADAMRQAAAQLGQQVVGTPRSAVPLLPPTAPGVRETSHLDRKSLRNQSLNTVGFLSTR